MAADIKQTVTPFPLTRAQAITAIGAGTIMQGRAYKITDKGDKGILLTGVMEKDGFMSAPTLSREGTRLMLVPKTYAKGVFSGITWLGEWNAVNVPSIGSVCIWGGQVWVNTSGTNGSVINDTTLTPTSWTAISKSAINASQYYIEKDFPCSYDIQNDWIEKQYDEHGNECGISWYEQTNIYGFLFNPVDITDWNMNTATNVAFANNSAIGIYNNYLQQQYSSSSSSYITGIMVNNHIPGVITRNTSNIFNNTNTGNISENTTLTIGYNTNNGPITQNTSALSIIFNSNNGGVFKNESIGINYNANNGNIDNNLTSKQILNNTNNGNISTNSRAVGLIAHNQNNGDISNNSNIGDIYQNQNNGYILSCTSAVPVHIFNNINNGTIGPATYVANVTDPIVVK